MNALGKTQAVPVDGAKRPLRRIALYMFYNPAGEVPDYVVYKLGKLQEHVEKTVVVCNGKLTAASRDALESVADVVHVRENIGFDVWAYREGLIDVIGWDALASYDELLLLNYTFYGPIFPFGEMFDRMAATETDFWGITAFVGPVPNFFTGSGTIPTHIQSHFIAVRQPMLASKAFRAYWEMMPPIKTYVDSVLHHECRFSEHFEKAGFTYALYCKPEKYAVNQAAYEALDLTLEDRCPILKRKPFFNDPANVDASNVDIARALALIKSRSDYDPELIWKDIAPVAKPRDLYTNATLFEVPDDTTRVPVKVGTKIAVLAHVYYPDLLPEMLSYARNIPVKFDLFITTSSAEKKKQITAMVPKDPGFTLKEVRVTENRGRDVAALVVGFHDVVTTGGYDYICRLHSKASPQDKFGMARHFKEHLFENLLLSPAYVSNLLAIFEREPNVGVVFPPTIHIGYPTLGRSWFANKIGCEHWAKQLKITVPFDDHTPLCAHGSMYWFRPQALKLLFDYGFKWTDFNQEPFYQDGDLPHVLERLVVYAAHQQGFYGKCVLTPSNAAKNYVKLEYKLQQLMGDGARVVKQQPAWPNRQLKEFVIDQMQAVPRTLKAIRSSYKAARTVVQAAQRTVKRLT